MKVREVMTTGVSTAELSTRLDEIATIMRFEDVGAVPIVDDDELVGIVTDRDIVIRCVAEGNDPSESTAEDILTEGLITVAPDDDVVHAAELMLRNQIRRLPVIHNNHLLGMVSLGAIAAKQSAHASQKAEARGEHHAAAQKKEKQRVVPIESGRHPRRKTS